MLNLTMKKKQWIINIGKLALAAFIIYYMIVSGNIDLHQILSVNQHPFLLTVCISSFGFIFVPMSYRWYILLRAQGIILGFNKTVGLTYTGAFFNNFLLGSIGGDLVKAYYVSETNPELRLESALSVFVDRAIGLYTLLLMASVALGYYYFVLPAAYQILFYLIICTLLVGLVLFVIIGKIQSLRLKSFKSLLLSIPVLGKIIKRTFQAFRLYWWKKRYLAIAILVTIFIQSFSIFNFWILYKALGFQSLSLGHFFFIIPIVYLIMAVPISPMGIGVGQITMHQLFADFGANNPAEGANLITLYQTIIICVNCLGVIPYLRYKISIPKPSEDRPAQSN
jgi:glycosyltransferase 2 family protein